MPFGLIRWLRAAIRPAAGSAAVAAALWVGAAHAKDIAVTPVPGAPTIHIGAYDIGELGYAAEEFFVAGEATSYATPGPLAPDGRWQAAPAGHAAYKTRLIVLRPKDAARFNGTVAVEWLNVSGGLDAPADWLMAHREFVREGYAYVMVSAQKVGVEGGPSLGADMSLKKTNPARYGGLSHPGDAFAYDIFSDAGRLVRRTGQGAIMGPLVPKRVLAAGESQSAHFMTTYVNAIDPLAKVYDGFLIHSRFAGAAPLDGRSMMGGQATDMPGAVKFRPDLRVPVLTVITETDLVGAARSGYFAARQPDTERLRVWEVPGTAHADNYTVQVAPIDTGSAPLDSIVAAYAPTSSLMGQKLAKPINFAPQHHYVVEAAFSSLDRWVRTGRPPAKAPRIQLSDGSPPALVLDANGLAKGGIRTPWVDVPIARTSGVGNGGNIMASLFGSGEVFDAATVARLYPGGKADYLRRFGSALDSAIRAGFILAADRREILELAAAMYPQADLSH